MGSVVITITDVDDGIDVQMGFDPPIADTNQIESLAHAVAINFVEFAATQYEDDVEADAEGEV
jgi:hypothetical protein